MSYFGWRPYVPVAEKRRQAERKLGKLKKQGRSVAPVTIEGRVPSRSVVVPGTRKRRFPAGEFEVGCALIVGQRKESTDRKTSLNDALRDFGIG